MKEHHHILYYNLLTACKLNDHLADIDQQAQELFFRLVKQMAEREGVTEALKALDSMAWVGLGWKDEQYSQSDNGDCQ